MRRLALAALAGVLAAGALPPAPAQAATREKWDTRVFARVPSPGFPAYVHVSPQGRVYAGTYIHADDTAPSRVFEWTRDGTLLRSWGVPGQVRSADHGVQVAGQSRDGKLLLLETSQPRLLSLDPTTGRFRTVARFPDLPVCQGGDHACTPNATDYPAVPNYLTWGPRANLYVTDYHQAVIWRIHRGTGTPEPWFTSAALDGTDFGTTGIRYRPAHHDLLITQQAVADGSGAPTNGALYRLPIEPDGSPGELETLWTSQPTDLPDGFGIGESGHVYIAMAGLTNRLAEIDPETGTEVDSFPAVPMTGDNGSAIPFDTPCSATFLGSRVLVANQSAVQGDATHQAVLDVYVGERGVAPYLPRRARVD